jgi:hypothetical protein
MFIWGLWAGGGPPFYPTGDVAAGGWVASNGGTLASCIDEPTTPNDTDYISSANPTSAAIMNIGPLNAGTWAIKVRSNLSTGTGTLTAKLRDSGSVLDTQTQAITSTITTYTLNFTIGSTADRISIEVA